MPDQKQLLVIASYPPRGEKHSKAIVGGAMYAKNTLEEALNAAKKEGKDPEIIVLAERFQNKKESYIDNGIRVERFWRKNSLATFPSLFRSILFYKRARTVVVEFELVMFGEAPSLLLLPLFLLFLRLTGRKTIFVFHQVLSDVSEMSGHLNLPEKSLKTTLYNFLYQRLYYLLLTFSSEAVVFEEVLKKRLHKLNRAKKVIVIPFGTEKFSIKEDTENARKALGLPTDTFIVFYFGFIAWYKGADWLVDTWSKLSDEAKQKSLLILGGGPNPNHVHKPFYASYIHSVDQKSKENGIMVTGFIPEERMPLYFQSCDLVILPYRTLMSSSGPLSLAFSFQKPALLSAPLTPLFETEDMKETLSSLQLTKDDLTFPLDTSFPQRIEYLLSHQDILDKLALFSKTIGERRSWEKIGKLYAAIFFS